MKSLIESAERILLPGGREADPCVTALQEKYDIDVPTFKDRCYTANASGKEWRIVKGKDIPELIVIGAGDVGLAGTDVCIEYGRPGMRYWPIGEAMCRFSLLGDPVQVNTLTSRLQALRSLYDDSPRVWAVTSFPRLLRRAAEVNDLPVSPLGIMVSGKVEGLADIIPGADLEADLVSSGDTFRQNNRVEIMSLRDIFPAVVARGEVNSTV